MKSKGFNQFACLSISIFLFYAFNSNALSATSHNNWLVMLNNMSPFVGGDAKWWYTQGASNWNHLLSSGSPGGLIYTGFKFHDLFGLELGYERSNRVNHQHVFGVGDTFFGTNPQGVRLNTKVQFSSLYLDLNTYIPMDDPIQGCLDFILSFGIDYSKPKVSVTLGAGATAFTPAQRNGLYSIRGSGRYIYRVGGGFQYMFTEQIGTRAMVRYESSGRMQISGNSNFYSQFDHHIKKVFTETLSFSVGLLYKF